MAVSSPLLIEFPPATVVAFGVGTAVIAGAGVVALFSSGVLTVSECSRAVLEYWYRPYYKAHDTTADERMKVCAPDSIPINN